MVTTAFLKTPSGRVEIGVSASPSGVVSRSRGKPILLSPLSAKAKPVALQPSNMAPIPESPAILPTDPQIAGTVGTQPSPLFYAQMHLAGAALSLMESTSGAELTSAPGDGDASLSAPATVVAVVGAVAKQFKPRGKRKKTALLDAPLPVDQLKYLTIPQMPLRYPAFTEKSIRHNVAQAENYLRFPKAGLKSNGGLINCIVRPAGQRKILIDTEKFELWLASYSAQCSASSVQCSSTVKPNPAGTKGRTMHSKPEQEKL
jgi:hypothetical protein